MRCGRVIPLTSNTINPLPPPSCTIHSCKEKEERYARHEVPVKHCSPKRIPEILYISQDLGTAGEVCVARHTVSQLPGGTVWRMCNPRLLKVLSTRDAQTGEVVAIKKIRLGKAKEVRALASPVPTGFRTFHVRYPLRPVPIVFRTCCVPSP